MFKKVYLFLLLLPISVFAYISPGSPSGFVNDFAGVLSPEQVSAIETKISDYENISSNEISVVIIDSLAGDTIENFSEELFSEWGIGKKGRDNGVLLLIAVKDKKMRIEVGYGLEGALTDIQSDSIINNSLRPAFRNNDFYGGIDRALDDIISATRGEYVPRDQVLDSDFIERYINIFFYIFVAIIWLVSVLARSKSWWAGGVVGFIFAMLVSSFLGFVYIGLMSLIFFVPLGLFIDFIVSRAYERGVKTGNYPWWIGGGPHGPSHWGGGGFGGFGGGRSGGGGSSGDW